MDSLEWKQISDGLEVSIVGQGGAQGKLYW
jgi:hypothetical protein